MVFIKERFRLFKAALAKLAYFDDYLHQIMNYQHQKQLMENNVLFSIERGTIDSLYDGKRIVVSLTTHGKRIHSVFQSIESIFRQTCKPNAVILYLSKEVFNNKNIPISLLRQCERGLEIRYVKDVKSYTKLVPALIDFPEDIIVTIDDDYIYPFDLLERLIRVHKQHPSAVCCWHSKIMKESLKGLAPYNEYKANYPEKDSESMAFLAEGFCGVLYPPHVLHPDVTREELFLKLAPWADDLWFKAMEMLQGTPVVQLANDEGWIYKFASDESVQDIGLKNMNVIQNKNDEQLKAIFDHYNLYGIISSS